MPRGSVVSGKASLVSAQDETDDGRWKRLRQAKKELDTAGAAITLKSLGEKTGISENMIRYFLARNPARKYLLHIIDDKPPGRRKKVPKTGPP